MMFGKKNLCTRELNIPASINLIRLSSVFFANIAVHKRQLYEQDITTSYLFANNMNVIIYIINTIKNIKKRNFFSLIFPFEI